MPKKRDPRPLCAVAADAIDGMQHGPPLCTARSPHPPACGAQCAHTAAALEGHLSLCRGAGEPPACCGATECPSAHSAAELDRWAREARHALFPCARTHADLAQAAALGSGELVPAAATRQEESAATRGVLYCPACVVEMPAHAAAGHLYSSGHLHVRDSASPAAAPQLTAATAGDGAPPPPRSVRRLLTPLGAGGGGADAGRHVSVPRAAAGRARVVPLPHVRHRRLLPR